MVRINATELKRKIQLSQANRRMPILCAYNQSLAWRSLSEGVAEETKGLRSNGFEFPNEKYLTSIAVSDNDVGFIAMGSACRQKDGKFYLYFVKDAIAPTNISVEGSRFELLHTEKLDIPIYSLDWSGTHLLVGSKHGITRLYTVHRQVAIVDTIKTTQVAEFVMPREQVHNTPVVPEKYPMNSIVKAVQFNSNYSDDIVYQQWQPLTPFSQDEMKKEDQDTSGVKSTELLSTFMSQVNVWDALREERPKYMYNVDSSPVNCATWSPHDPHSLIVTGGCDRALNIIDVRTNGVVWQAEEAHARPIRDAKFNTFIPYWLASAGEDAVVNIYDIRACYRAPVARITGHNGIVESLSWSNMRCEDLSTTSSDGTFRYWSLNQKVLPVEIGFYETCKWSKNDTPPTTARPQSKALWQLWSGGGHAQEPWSKIDRHIYYDNSDDPWGNSHSYDPETMAMPGAIGIGEWGRTDTGPVYIGEDFDKSKGPVIKVAMSKWLLADYYCITAQGQLCVQAVRLEDKDALDFTFRINKHEYPLANQIEYDIYSRHIDDARENLEQLKYLPDDEEDSARNDHVSYLEECLKVLPPISSDKWDFDTLPDKSDRRISRRLWNEDDLWDYAITVFSQDLEYWGGCRLPPGYATRHKFPLNLKERSMIVTPSISPEIASPSKDVQSPFMQPPTSTNASSKSPHISPMATDTVDEEAPTSEAASEVSQHSYQRTWSMSRSRTTISRKSTPSVTQSTDSSTPHHNPFVKPTQSLKRIFSARRGKSRQPSIKATEQEVVDGAPPEPQVTRKRTVRRNALFGAS